MTSKFRRGSFRSSWELGAQNTHIYDENRIFSVFRRESKAEFVALCQSQKAANPRNRKSLQNPSGITFFLCVRGHELIEFHDFRQFL